MKRVLIPLLSALLLSSCNFNSKVSLVYENAERYQIGSVVKEATIKNLDITWINGDIVIKPSTDNYYHVEEIASEEDIPEEWGLHTLFEDEILHVKWCASGEWQFKKLSKDLTILVPESSSIWDNVLIDTISGSVSIEDQKAKSLTVDAVSSRIDLIGGSIDSISIDSVSSNVNLKKAEFQSFEADLSSGYTDILLKEDIGFTLRYDTASGNRDISLPITVKNGAYVHGDGSLSIKVDSVSGGIKIHLEE